MRLSALSERRMAKLRKENELLRAECDELHAAQQALREEAAGPPRVVPELLALSDLLTELSGELGKPADAERTAAVVRWLESRLTRLFDACEVGTLLDEGPADPARQEVVGARPAEDGRSVGHIAETVRPGYQWHGDVLRPQQVIVYGEPEADVR